MAKIGFWKWIAQIVSSVVWLNKWKETREDTKTNVTPTKNLVPTLKVESADLTILVDSMNNVQFVFASAPTVTVAFN